MIDPLTVDTDGRSAPTLVVNPASDLHLAARAREIVRSGGTARELTERLRADYPRLVVHRRELSGEDRETWYVYREGHWISGAPERDDGARSSAEDGRGAIG